VPHQKYEVGTLAVDGWAVTFGTARRGLGTLRPLLAVPNVTAHPSTASVPITVLLYNGPLLCGFNVPVRGFIKYNQELNKISVYQKCECCELVKLYVILIAGVRFFLRHRV